MASSLQLQVAQVMSLQMTSPILTLVTRRLLSMMTLPTATMVSKKLKVTTPPLLVGLNLLLVKEALRISLEILHQACKHRAAIVIRLLEDLLQATYLTTHQRQAMEMPTIQALDSRMIHFLTRILASQKQTLHLGTKIHSVAIRTSTTLLPSRQALQNHRQTSLERATMCRLEIFSAVSEVEHHKLRTLLTPSVVALDLEVWLTSTLGSL